MSAPHRGLDRCSARIEGRGGQNRGAPPSAPLAHDFFLKPSRPVVGDFCEVFTMSAELTETMLPPKPAWPDPTPEMLASPEFEAVWQCIKRWDINVPDVYSGYMGATGNHVRAILDALDRGVA
jgi:hypothetical protein